MRRIRLTDGSEWACNAMGEGVFSRRADGTWQQHTGTGQAGPFGTPRTFARHVRTHYAGRDGEPLPAMRRGSAAGWPS